MSDVNRKKFSWNIFLYELLGTGLLLMVGLSAVIFMSGTGSPAVQLIPDTGIRRLITGFLFGSTGACIAISPIGKVSGAHINPVVSLGFFLMRKIDLRMALSYISGQLIGAIIGCLPLLAWGEMGRSVDFGATIAGPGYSLSAVLLGEIITTFLLIVSLGVFLSFRILRPYTPALFPFLYAGMVYFEGAVSGTSTNPARSLGPAVVSAYWDHWWIYWIGPLTGAFLGTLAISFLTKRIKVAKLYHFDRHPDLWFRRKNVSG
jgi:aquaporin Z